MSTRLLTGVLSAAAAAVATLLSAPAPIASAEPCPDVEVVFARGTGQPPGLGGVGDAFVDALRSRVGPKTVDAYAVQYPATIDFPRAIDGVNDASAHIQATAASCPTTRIVLGGYSQGAAVAGFVTSSVVPPGAVDYSGTGPMPASVADHVAAVTLFGTPAPRFMGLIGQPTISIGPLYADKTLQLCVPGDPICTDQGGDYSLHDRYISDGFVDQGADFAAGRLGPLAPASAPTPYGSAARSPTASATR